MQLQTLGYDAFWLYSVSAVIMVSMITAVLSCLCCRRKQEIKNDLLGLEGMVKLTNLEDTLLNSGSNVAINATAASTANGGPQGTASANASNLRPASVGGGQGFGSDTESSSKRTSNAPHRSLPDIPIAEPAGDNNSELYATVGDKVQDLPQGRSPSASLKKQTSVSQHSSISQADDISSPYARVRSPPHAYDKLRRMEHPYAQVAQPAGNASFEGGTSGGPSGVTSRAKPRDGDDDDDDDEDDDELMSPISRRESAQNLEDRETSTVDIPAASAIAGRVSASQDLPYMTPPIVQPSTQHFNGDSQDSSKGYTSISVREPLANLLPQNMPNQTTAKRRQILGDSHYATVSDDLDEMYAAIDDPGNQGDLYTSGSETYAQIQPPNAMTVSVEINTGASSRPQPPPLQTLHPATMNDFLDSGGSGAGNNQNSTHSATASNRLSNHNTMDRDEHGHGHASHLTPSGVVVVGGGESGGLRAQTFVQHSRQASSSSCTSSVGNLGSPKPEKRQANSPHQANNFFNSSNQSMLGSGNASSTTTVTSGRNSAASVIECVGSVPSNRENAGNKPSTDGADSSATLPNGSAVGNKQKKSPSKDLEGMYAKVMKKNKLSKVPSQNSSPVPLRKDGSADDHLKQQFLSDTDVAQFNGSGSLHGGSPSRKQTAGAQRNSTGTCSNKDPGYETIPGDSAKTNATELNRKSADYAQIQKLHRNHTPAASELTAMSAVIAQADSEPGYESLPDTRGSLNDPGYETLNRGSNRTESDSDPNYEILRPAGNNNNNAKPNAQATTATTGKLPGAVGDTNRDSDGYSSIREPPGRTKNSAKNRLDFGGRRGGVDDDDTDGSTPGYSSIREKDDYDPGYSVISERKNPPPGHDYASITEEAKKRKPNINNNLEPDDESDIYSSIPHTGTSGTLTLLTSPSLATVPGGGPAGSPGTTPPGSVGAAGALAIGPLSSSPGYSSISETRTTPSSTDDGDGDGGSTSSPDQLIGYSKHNSNTNTNTTATTNNSLSRISSNYDEFTGSESDPNYESVKYLNVKENPYERLHNEAAGESSVSKSVTNDSLTTDSDTATPTPATHAPVGIRRGQGTPDSDAGGGGVPTTTTTAVSDYFQV